VTQFLELLDGNSPDAKVVSRYLLDSCPSIFDGDSAAYLQWREDLGSRIEVDLRNILVVGSSCVGVSLNPHKSFRSFGDHSDVDVAVVSQRHFDESWRHLRGPKSRRARMPHKIWKLIITRTPELVYWGAINTDRILPYLPFARGWMSAIAWMANQEPTVGREINIRLYRDIESLRDYQLKSVREARKIRREAGV